MTGHKGLGVHNQRRGGGEGGTGMAVGPGLNNQQDGLGKWALAEMARWREIRMRGHVSLGQNGQV